MGLFDFSRQRMHTQLHGSTTGAEMFKVTEYNQVKGLTFGLGTVMVLIFTVLYFFWGSISMKVKFFMFLVFIGCAIWEYYNVKHQMRVRNSLY